MPYTVANPPEAIKGLPKHLIEIWVAAFNSAFKQYDGNEGKAAGTAWAAVKTKYKKNPEGKWVSKEARMKLSDKNKRQLLQSALLTGYKMQDESPIPKDLQVEEVFDEELTYTIDGQSYKASYEIVEGKVILGEPEKVLKQTIYKTMESLSMENRKTILETALFDQLSLTSKEWVFIEDMTETEVIYNYNRQSYKASYVIAEDGVVTFGEPVEVVRQVTYKTVEALQSAYSELIQEVGRRNANLDSARIKKIVALCQELLSSDEEPEEKKTKEALKEAASVLTWLKEQAAMKTEDGVKFPAAAYAYVPDREKSSTWKLRLWEDPEKKITRAQLGRAAAALGPGGFRGQKVQIPSADLPAVKRKIRAEYRKLGVEDEDIPRQVRESWAEVPGKGTVWKDAEETRERILNYVPLTEAKFDKGRATVIVIKAGFNATEDRYYPAEMLKRDYGIFEGQKMYADHPTEEEDKERPERSIKDWVATLTEVKCDENGTVTGVADIIEEWLMKKLASLREKNMLSEMGISINAVGSASKATIDGKETLVIEKLTAAKSVDFVTEPGAGGVVTLYESDRNHDIDLIELAALKEQRPDLVKAIEAKVREEITKEVKKAMEDKEKITEFEGQIEELTTERDGL